MSNWIFKTTKGTFLNVKDDGICEDEYGVKNLTQFLYEETEDRLSPDLNRVSFCANKDFIKELEEQSITKTFLNFIRV